MTLLPISKLLALPEPGHYRHVVRDLLCQVLVLVPEYPYLAPHGFLIGEVWRDQEVVVPVAGVRGPDAVLSLRDHHFHADGLAHMLDEPKLTSTGFLPGTPLCMSPEQARGEKIGRLRPEAEASACTRWLSAFLTRLALSWLIWPTA